MDKIIIEKMETCSLVRQGSDGALGEYEPYNYNYVIVNGSQEKVYKGMFIVHDGENVHDIGHISNLKDNLRPLLDDQYDEKLKKERKQNYLKLKKEFEHEK
jgi:hypothetical protein